MSPKASKKNPQISCQLPPPTPQKKIAPVCPSPNSTYKKPLKEHKLTEFDKLRRVWNEKLAASGFEDIEFSNERPESQLWSLFAGGSSSTALGLRQHDDGTFKQEYFILATHFLNNADFRKLFGTKGGLYKYIWHLHSEGVSMRNIARLLAGSRKVRKELQNMKLPYIRTYLRRTHSVFWVHTHIHIIRAEFLKYAKAEIEAAQQEALRY